MRKILTWLDEHILFLFAGFLLAFIPLYPKLPLFDIIPGYIVRVRIEDFLVGIAIILWVIQMVRKKASFGPNPLAKPIGIYLVIGILSMLSAIFIIKTIPLQPLHIGKMVLHFLRRVEYFSLFFIFYSSVKSLRQVKIYLVVLLATIIAITLYGYGQKYLYWPAFSTMNREYSKGWVLYLSEHARVLSTFGGHYDLAAYTMGALILLWGLFFGTSKRLLQAVILVALGAAFWLLILTASRTSFIAYILGVTILFFLFMFKKGIKWSAVRWFGVIMISMVIMISFGDLSERFTKLFKLDARIANIKSLILHPIGSPPKSTNDSDLAILENNPDAIGSKSDIPPQPNRPVDVINDIPNGFTATQSATGSGVIVSVPRTYSKTAMVYDLSTGIRLDALWPMAIKGFKRNPLLGSGYSTLNKSSLTDFTDAESTDNDYLRNLGETGLLGLLSFGWILMSITWIIWSRFYKIKDMQLFTLVIGLFAVICGLLVNAVYIDVFESSKVAFSFWAFVGIVLGAFKFLPKSDLKEQGSVLIPSIPDLKDTIHGLIEFSKKMVRSHKTYVGIILILAFCLRYYKIDTPLADWHSWRQADTSAVTRNFVRYGIDPLYPRYDDLSSIASGKDNPEGYRFVEFPIYNIASVITDKLFPGYTVEHSGRLTSIFASLGSIIFIYLITRKYTSSRTALFAAFFYAVVPYNIFWTRVILPESTLTFLCLGMLYFFDRWIFEEALSLWVTSLIFGILALLVKFTAVFFAIPMVYLAWRKWGWKIITKPLLYLYPVFLVIPFFLWRVHIAKYPEGIPAYDWLFNGNGIRFKGAFFWWLFQERMVKMILGGWGIILFGIGFIKRNELHKKAHYIFHAWLLGMIVYLSVFATGNVQHDYYQIILVPILCIFMALGSELLLKNEHQLIHPIFAKILLSISIIFMLMFGWYQARDLYNINHSEIVEAGQEFDRTVGDKKGTVIAPYNGDTAFLYQTGRKGWPIMEGSIDDMIDRGADFYVSVNYDDVTNDLIKIAQTSDIYHQFKILKQTEKFVIIQLVPDNRLPKN